MKGFLLWSLVCGFACLAAYVVLALWRKKPPVLQEGIAMFISGSGLVGGGKIFWLVFSGELSKLIQAQPVGAASNVSPEDVVYFAVGGIALVWLSLETIAKRLATFFSDGKTG